MTFRVLFESNPQKELQDFTTLGPIMSEASLGQTLSFKYSLTYVLKKELTVQTNQNYSYKVSYL